MLTMRFIQYNTNMKKEHIIRLIKIALKDMWIYRKLSELGFHSERHSSTLPFQTYY